MTEFPTEPSPAAEERVHPYSRRFAAFYAAAALCALVAAGLAGAVIGHAVWATRGSPAATGNDGGFPSFGNGSFGNGHFGLGGSVTLPSTSGSASGAPADVASIAKKVSPGLVDIDVQLGYQSAGGAGTGIVLTSDGEVLTNNHVISGATKITATDVGNGKTYTATVVGYDPSHDLAVLQLQNASGLQTAKLGRSSTLKSGDAVVGIGNAGGTGGTPSTAGGSVTALGASVTAADELSGSRETLTGLIQTNAPIQPGDSGGPLANESGEVVGIDTAGSSDYSFGSSTTQAYAIPIDTAVEIAKQIETGRGSETVHVGETAFLGVEIESSGFGRFGAGGQGGTGLTVGDVVSGDPAEKAGLAAGDTITALDGQSVDSQSAIAAVLLRHHPGDAVSISWTDSSGQSHTANVTLASGPPA